MIKVLAMLPSSKDATVFYRSELPLIDLGRHGVSYTDFIQTEPTWADIARNDVVYMQRPVSIHHLISAERTKSVGIPLWVDYDDDLLNIPEHNDYSVYAKANKENIIAILKLADVITVSTEALKVALGHENKTIVIPNAYSDDFFEYAKKFQTKRNNFIAWRGSATHKYDLAEVKSAILRFYDNKEFKFLFMGYNPEFITLNFDKDSFVFSKPKMIFEYLKTFHRFAPLITIVPLEDDLFNRAKSNIAYIEATHAGSLTIARNLPEFNKPGIVTYDTPDQLYDLLEFYTKNPRDILSKIEESRNYIKENLLLSKINKKRLSMLKTLTGK